MVAGTALLDGLFFERARGERKGKTSKAKLIPKQHQKPAFVS